jgi:hypothetical protein
LYQSLVIQVHFCNQTIQAFGPPTVIFGKLIYDLFYRLWFNFLPPKNNRFGGRTYKTERRPRRPDERHCRCQHGAVPGAAGIAGGAPVRRPAYPLGWLLSARRPRPIYYNARHHHRHGNRVSDRHTCRGLNANGPCNGASSTTGGGPADRLNSKPRDAFSPNGTKLPKWPQHAPALGPFLLDEG